MWSYFVACLLMIFCTVSDNFAQGSLEKYKWKNRIALIFASSDQNEEWIKQRNLLESDSAGLKERDLLVFLVTPDTGRQLNSLKKYYEVRESFTFVLIGKDGGEKLTSYSAVSLQRLFGLIDSMPMRKAEMKETKKEKDNE